VRSGTTLLRSLCNGHPEMAITDEFKFFSGLGQTYREHGRRLIKRLWRQTLRNKTRWKWNLDSCTFGVRYLFNLHRHRNHLIDVQAIESTLQSIFPEARIIGDKTPSYVFLLDKLVMITGLRCLIIFDVTSSVLERVRAKWNKRAWSQTVDTAEKVAKRWVRSIEFMESHKEQIHIIRYEDLVREPRRELEALARWLGVEFAGFPKERIRDNSIGKYKNGLTDEELKTVMEIAGPTMARLGYV
jgi:hypothetical protein